MSSHPASWNGDWSLYAIDLWLQAAPKARREEELKKEARVQKEAAAEEVPGVPLLALSVHCSHASLLVEQYLVTMR
jgi:hypothetical protein